VEHGGDAVCDRLTVAVDQGDIDRKVDASARHHLALERIAMEVDDTRQHEKIAGIKLERGGFLACIEAADFIARN